MSATHATSTSQLEADSWPSEVIQLLDDHHLVVVTDRPQSGERFGDMLVRRMTQLADTHVVVLDGQVVTDVPSFCRLVELQSLTRSERRDLHQSNTLWRDMQSVIKVLRRTGLAMKRRYFVWHNADALLGRDRELFNHLVNALLGVAAEQEFIVPDALTIQRTVFIGGQGLADYAENPESQFNRWLDEEGSPLWEVASVLERPPVLTYRLEAPTTS